MRLDVDFVRRQYAVYQQPELAEWAFFENAGGSYVPEQVVTRLEAFFRRCKVQPYGPFESSQVAGQAMDEGLRCVAELLNADEDDITVGPSTTLNCYVLAQALRPSLRPGDEVVVTNQDHEANIGCWERLSEFGAVIKWWEIDPLTGELPLERLHALVTDRTRIICFPMCSNIIGSMQDVRAITALAREVGAVTVADGVSYAPHQMVDVQSFEPDVYLFSTYKTFGTHLGIMWLRRSLADRIAPQGHFFNRDKPRYRMNPTGPLHAEIAALAGIGQYFDALHDHHFGQQGGSRSERARRLFTLFAEHETALANHLLDTLRELPSVRIVGRSHAIAGERAATVSFVPHKLLPSELARAMAGHRIAVRSGHFYALRCLRALGIADPEEGVVRVSMVHYNTHDEVDRLCAALRSAC